MDDTWQVLDTITWLDVTDVLHDEGDNYLEERYVLYVVMVTPS